MPDGTRTYRFRTGQLVGLILCSISLGLNGALLLFFLAERRWGSAAGSGLATLAMILCIVALLRLAAPPERAATSA